MLDIDGIIILTECETLSPVHRLWFVVHLRPTKQCISGIYVLLIYSSIPFLFTLAVNMIIFKHTHFYYITNCFLCTEVKAHVIDC